ncbi:MAG: DUF4298 domain-containing protein [Clostridia bacterium]|nr:DUF4298 domain-containing protein [Clostridia bacterium]
MNEQIKRIMQMESLLNAALSLIKKDSLSPEEMQTLKQLVDQLDVYYSGPLWRMDYEADEKGLLPRDLNRGVLSEDGIWNLLTDYTALLDEE